ncbi:zinc finger protein ZAT5 [Punica granatum]|uniref:C2H2-type domain-containing protein n=2 Tax=Punica granatum TaxID=22663 RepID=A0A218WP22_PUNGR|nr:zinc finger protein ZAT5 [Punica granatum]OWM73742.1 hypothetical protein CDL15_Pgr026846 [Punica granatum]PKI64579.1 hypothetical protein CRG98_015011 [Punica granatum]
MGGLEAEERPLAGVADDGSLMIIKGKRTKRPRTPSACGGGSITAASSSSTSGGSGGGDCDLYPSSSSGTMLESTEEKDMAYCLILLAQGPRRQRDEDQADAKMESDEFSGSSKKFSEVATTGGASSRAGFYVYECKTCSRTFPSFQALGGHRASHKKPRPAEDPKKSPTEPNSDEDEEVGQFRKITISPPLSSSIPNFPSKLLQASKPKIHECSICGSEFSSGQALGGHMRRHRAVAAPPTTSGHATMIDSVITDHYSHGPRIVGENTSRPGAVLSLDLNLPAPEDDPKFQFAPAPAQKPLLFSGPALVDCHY